MARISTCQPYTEKTATLVQKKCDFWDGLWKERKAYRWERKLEILFCTSLALRLVQAAYHW
jgi:hypothetical protein